MTGRRPRPQPLSSGRYSLHPLAATQASHSSNVTSYMPAAKDGTVTRCCGLSSSKRPGSVAGEPIVKLPLCTTTICGQSVQSLNVSPGLRSVTGGVGAEQLTRASEIRSRNTVLIPSTAALRHSWALHAYARSPRDPHRLCPLTVARAERKRARREG